MDIGINTANESLIQKLSNLLVLFMLVSYQLYSLLPPIFSNVLKIILPFIALIVVLLRNDHRLVKNLSILWLYFFIGLSIFSLFYTVSITQTLDRLLALFSLFLFVITLSQYVVSEYYLDRVITYIICGTFIYIVLFLILNLKSFGNIFLIDFPMEINNIVTPSIYYIIWRLFDKNNNTKIYFILFSIFYSICLISGIKKAIVFPFVFLFFFLNEEYKGNALKKVVYLFGIFLLFFLVGYFIFNNPILYELVGVRFEGLLNFFTGQGRVDGSTRTRFGLINDAWTIFKENPLLGVGLGSFREVTKFNVYAHNNFMELLASLGIVGFLFFYWLPIYLIFKIKNSKILNDKYSQLFFSVIITNLIHDIGTISYYRFSFIIPLCLASAYIEINRKREVTV